MELPKHTKQVGTIGATKKLYLEDYCISYIKQLVELYPEDRKQIALYGTVEKEKNIEYALVYGAALLGMGKGRTDSMTNSQKEEAEKYREEFFGELQLVGLVIVTDAVSESVYWMGMGNKSILMDGYYIFYDKNDVMLHFMIHNQKEERDVDLDPVIVKKADMDREKQEKRAKAEAEKNKGGKYRNNLRNPEKKAVMLGHRRGKSFPIAAGLILAATVGVYGVKMYAPSYFKGDFPEMISGAFENVLMVAGTYLDQENESILVVDNEVTSETVVTAVGTDVVLEPAELDVVVIPEIDSVDNTMQTEEKNPEIDKEVSLKEQDEIQLEEPPLEVTEAYLIKKGDSLLRILRAYYGDESKLQEICDVNGIVDPNNIQVGQTILLP